MIRNARHVLLFKCNDIAPPPVSEGRFCYSSCTVFSSSGPYSSKSSSAILSLASKLGRSYRHLLMVNTVLVDKLFHSTKEGDVGALFFLTIRAIGSSNPPLRTGDLIC